MFLIEAPRLDYRDPWGENFEARLRRLRRPDAGRRVAYLYETPDTSTFRYRVSNMIQALESDPDCAAAWFTVAEIPSILEQIPSCDAVVLCRTRYCDRVNELIARARAFDVTTFFDCDDFVFDPDYVQLVLDTLDQPLHAEAWDFWFAYVGRLGGTLRLCERVIVTNAYLAGRVRQLAPDKHVGVIPNFLNHEQLRVSDELRRLKRAGKWLRNGMLHLGYFSGTPTHNRNFAMVADGLARLLDRNRDLRLRIVGPVDVTGALRRHADRIERHDLQNFLRLQVLIAETEINLAPLQNNIFTNCKSDLKYFEAAAAGTVTIASPTHAFAQSIQHGENGFLSCAHQWADRLEEAFDSIRSGDGRLYPAMAECAAARAIARYAPETMREIIATVLMPDRRPEAVVSGAVPAAG